MITRVCRPCSIALPPPEIHGVEQVSVSTTKPPAFTQKYSGPRFSRNWGGPFTSVVSPSGESSPLQRNFSGAVKPVPLPSSITEVPIHTVAMQKPQAFRLAAAVPSTHWGHNQIQHAVVNNRLCDVKRLLEQGESPFVRDAWNNTLLHLAAAAGHIELFTTLKHLMSHNPFFFYARNIDGLTAIELLAAS